MPAIVAPVIAVYKFKAATPDPEIHDMLRRHRAALIRGGYTTERLPYVLRSFTDRSIFVEIFDWKSVEDSRRANADPLVRAVWDEFAARCETVGLPIKNLPEAEHPFSQFESFPMTYEAAKSAPMRKRAAPTAKLMPLDAAPPARATRGKKTKPASKAMAKVKVKARPASKRAAKTSKAAPKASPKKAARRPRR